VRFPRRVAATAVASTLAAAALTGCTSDDEPGAVTDVVIGADLASGSAVDTAYARALQLKVEQLNASGALGDRRLVLRIQDNRFDPTSSLRNIGAFADDPAVAAVITGACGECAVEAAGTVNKQQVPTISLAAADQVSEPVAERRWMFKVGPNTADSVAALTTELVRERTSSVALLHSDDLYGRGGGEEMRKELTKAGIEITGTVAVKPTSTDLGQAVGGLVESRPQALIAMVGPELAGLAAISAKGAGFTGRLYYDAAAAGDMFIGRDAAAATNDATMVFTQILAIDDVIATTPAKASRKQWFRDYTSRYGSYSGVASFAADAADLIATAVARVGGDRGRIRDILETSQIDGLSGPIRITPDNHSGLMPQALTLLVARSGRWRIAS
jgi:branched-chain amino acid transport system substrate-binding protein